MEDKILEFLKARTHTEGRYIGGGDEPQIIVFTNSEDSDKDSFLTSLAEELAKQLYTQM